MTYTEKVKLAERVARALYYMKRANQFYGTDARAFNIFHADAVEELRNVVDRLNTELSENDIALERKV